MLVGVELSGGWIELKVGEERQDGWAFWLSE
jgi:hypothetical protein